MLHGTRVVLRGRLPADVVALDELRGDVETWGMLSGRPWRPLALEEPSMFGSREPEPNGLTFTVADAATDEVLGHCGLWRLDRSNRRAHLGVSLLRSHRAKGYATESVGVLCRYAFATLGLHRLQVVTDAGNVAMISVAERAGFVREATLRRATWHLGAHRDEAVFGLLDREWRERVREPEGT